MLSNYLHHLVREAHESSIPGNPYSILLPDQFCNLTWKEFMAWRLDNSNQNTNSGSITGHRGYIQQDSSYESNQNAYQLLAFKKSIKRDMSQYTMLKDEKYFEASIRSLLVTATTHGCEEILNRDYKPENNEDSRELFKQKQWIAPRIMHYISFALHFISFALHLKILPRQHEMHATS